MEGKKCVVMLASYNGEEYISAQIESILQQSYSNWRLIIRDDGSSDQTISIIKKYCEKDSRVILLEDDEVYHGPYRNFYYILKYVKHNEQSDYYFFSDQDDIWDTHKIENMMAVAENERSEYIPIAVYADMSIIDENGQIKEASINDVCHIEIENPLNLFFSHSYLWGCNMMFNNALLEIVRIPQCNEDDSLFISHDNYLGKYAVCFGKLIYLNYVCMQHRVHNSNVTQLIAYRWNMHALFIALKKFNRIVKEHEKFLNHSLYTINQLKRCAPLPQQITDVQTVIIVGGIRAIKLMRELGIKRKNKPKTFLLYLLMLLKMYRFKEYV